MRPSSPLLDSVRDNFESREQLAEDFSRAFSNPTKPETELVSGETGKPVTTHLFDVSFNVGQGKNKTKLYGVRAILGVRSRLVNHLH
jgi:RAP1 GTPase activating protein 1